MDTNFLNSIKYKKSFKESLYNRLVLAAEREIFDMVNHEIAGSYNLRYQIENLLIGETGEFGPKHIFEYNREENIHSREITFHTVLVNNEPFTLRFSKSDFEGREIRIWRSMVLKYEGVKKASRFNLADINVPIFNKGAIDDRVQVLREIVEDNDGKVKIYIVPNVGENGYQYARHALQSIIPSDSSSSDSGHIVIDLTKDGNGNYIDPQVEMRLRYVVALSLAYAPSWVSRKNTMDFMFIIKKHGDDIDYNYGAAICIFNRNKFYELDEIHSEAQDNPEYRQISLSTFEKNYDWHKLTKEWSQNDRYMLINHANIFKLYDFTCWW